MTPTGETCDLLVIGGGPAGMMAAGHAAERGRRVILAERGPRLGRKLLLTASGRCNITNTAAVPEFLKAFGRHGEFLRDAFNAFGPAELIEWLRQRGIETMVERKGRVFPSCEDASVVLEAFEKWLKSLRVDVRLNERVETLRIEHGAVAGAGQFASPAVLVATGGLSYPLTGSSGDGYALARQAGHAIVAPFPAIIGLQTQETWPKKIQGTPIKNFSFACRQGGRKIAEAFGEGLWTHYGISGPAIFEVSRRVVLALRDGPVEMEIDLRPQDAEPALDEKLLFAIKRHGSMQVVNVLADWVAARAAEQICELAEVDPAKRMNQCSKSCRKRIIRLVKHLPLHIAGPRPIEEAIVTGGGVALAEVDPKRLESRLAKGLHFAGEVLDLDGPTGGYNLQLAFSTGWLVGNVVE